jgi:SAM-dependent methyltransferase
MDREAWQQRGQSFGPAADRYDRIRPGYPVEALRWILGDEPRRVVDLGAGTGILSRQLHALGHGVVPVEPDRGMRARLAAVSPITALDGSAEAIPLPDASVDAVVAGQAYHWFDPERANAEIARVLRPGGVVAALWNDRDASVEWLARLTEIADDIAHVRHRDDAAPATGFGPLFDPVEVATFRHVTRHTADTLVELVTSRSYYLTARPERQRAIVAAVRELVATHPQLAGRDEFDLPYVTVVYRATRRAQAFLS